jgi:hypothetical protein
MRACAAKCIRRTAFSSCQSNTQMFYFYVLKKKSPAKFWYTTWFNTFLLYGCLKNGILKRWKFSKIRKECKKMRKLLILLYAQTLLKMSKEFQQIKIVVWTSFTLLEWGNKFDWRSVLLAFFFFLHARSAVVFYAE